MRVVLAYKANREGKDDPYTSLAPLGLGYLQGVLISAGHHAVVANFSRSGWPAIRSFLRESAPDVVAISQFTHNRFESLRLADEVKRQNPKSFVVMGGPHATSRYRDILASTSNVDAIVLGEGEDTLREVVDALSKSSSPSMHDIRGLAFLEGRSVAVTPRRPPLTDMDLLPVPAISLVQSWGLDLRRQLEFITTSRGCPAACRFCSSPNFWSRQVRFRSPKTIVEEIRYIRDRFGLIYFSFRDDTFTADRKRVLELCRLLLEEQIYILWNCQSRVNHLDEELLLAMKRAGCECVQLGVESGSHRLLEALGKRIAPEQVRQAASAIRRVGINLSIYLITGIPGETREDVLATSKLIEEIRPQDGQISPLVYYPGTAMFAEAVAAGTVPGDLFEKNSAAAFPVLPAEATAPRMRTLLQALESVSSASCFKAREFRQQKRFVGYSHVTNLLAGEAYEGEGREDLAEREYLEIVRQQPANPWGWLALGDLCGGSGRVAEAREAYTEVIRLVPAHAPAYRALGDLIWLSGDRSDAKQYYRQVLQLDPLDEEARQKLENGRKAKK
ncbi:radical SAM protein [Geobacter sp. DSM 9736]|uniref:B12-binding domain-containing radical SAM protein n=1 Tax=Geobacter sp. DSM 9736 TaxID=1277350 RepID=UPI000B50F847|nr:radical SAM protein [Geobacter sp. DSM 9736]SNB46345.1 Radical SAM superfamily enzyme YgiQ, UPF0313 family [Geobacter sp. DSM 9736]